MARRPDIAHKPLVVAFLSGFLDSLPEHILLEIGADDADPYE